MKKLIFLVLLVFSFNLSFANTAFEDDVGEKDKIEFTQNYDDTIATSIVVESPSVAYVATGKDLSCYVLSNTDVENEVHLTTIDLLEPDIRFRKTSERTRSAFVNNKTGSSGGLSGVA